MFRNSYLSLLSLDSDGILVIILIILGLLLLIYLIIVIVSFSFMYNFKRDINRRKDFINVTLYQKLTLLSRLSEIMKDYLKENDPLKIMGANEDLKKYQKLTAQEFEEFYAYSEKILQNAQKIYINFDLDEDSKRKVEEIFLTIAELNDKYFQAVQLYNTSVVAYNYWYNFSTTRWIKKLLFMKTIDTIK